MCNRTARSFLSLAQRPWRFLAIAARTRGEPLASAAAVRTAIRNFDPQLAVYNTAPLGELLQERSAVRRLLLGLVLTFGVLAGAILAVPCVRLMQNLLFDTEPFDAFSIMIVAALLATTALLASWLPARRAARVDPLESLR